MNNKKYVKGNIIAESGYHIAKSFWALDIIPEDSEEENVIHGDLVLTAHNTLPPFYEYHATGGVTAYGQYEDGGILCIIPPTSVYDEALKDLDIINELLKTGYSNCDAQEALYKLCFFNAITTYEYYISNILVSLVLGNQIIFERFIHTEKITIDIKEVSDKICNIYRSVIRYIELFNYNDTKKLKRLFKKTLELDINELDDFSYYIDLRNSIAHRNGHPKYSEFSGKEKFTEFDVKSAIDKVKDIIKKINIKLQPIIENW